MVHRKTPTQLLQELDLAAAEARPTYEAEDGTLIVTDVELARSVLSNRFGLYAPHSDFFYTFDAPTCPRSAQRAIGQSAREWLDAYFSERAQLIPGLVAREIEGGTVWPTTGNNVLFHLFFDALCDPSRGPLYHWCIRHIVHKAVLSGSRARRSRIARFASRKTIRAILVRAARERASRYGAPCRDLLDVVVDELPRGSDPALAAEIMLSYVFAIVGTWGFTFAWALLEAIRNEKTTVNAEDLVREAIRMWPIPWIMTRTVATRHHVGEMSRSVGSTTLVSPYLIQRSSQSFRDPLRFDPGRWSERGAARALVAFGAGATRCAAATMTIQVCGELVRQVFATMDVRLVSASDLIPDGPALAPPTFELLATPRPKSNHRAIASVASNQ